MKLTIVTQDLLVVKDNEPHNVADLSYLDSNIHAIQWDDDKGEIEYKDGTLNKAITDISPYNQCVTDWETAKDEHIKATTPATPDWELAFKRYRNSLLKESDWTQVADNKLTDEKKAEWVVYRQALRDMPTIKTGTYEQLVKDTSHSDYPNTPS